MFTWGMSREQLFGFPGVNTQKWLQNAPFWGANTSTAARFKKLQTNLFLRPLENQ